MILCINIACFIRNKLRIITVNVSIIALVDTVFYDIMEQTNIIFKISLNNLHISLIDSFITIYHLVLI